MRMAKVQKATLDPSKVSGRCGRLKCCLRYEHDTYEDLERFPRENHVYFCECAANTGMEWAGAQLNGAQFTHGMIHNMEYTGVPLRTLLEEAGLDAAGDLKDKWVYVNEHC